MEEEQLCREIVTEAGDAILFADADGRIQLWNRGAEDVFGYTEAEALGESLDIIVPERFRDRHWAGYDDAMERGETTYDRGELLSVPAITKDGERISVAFTVTPIRDAGGEIAGIAAILRDVTDRWEAEQARRDRIEELEARLERFENDDVG